ncbi:hypothetical protein L873DRAFT_618752 [Choiromyces venosus 120613-1]|uniref:Uncharacterized protein n=1 Tax=Choiromyces venosus 120613-1 TaxID=1336337 RepID=A0A3N4IXX4_9PEZI|nr:hypothetical protein L873DRAFT_618752 [Choiromyces venosus 120613-1]
MFLLYIIYFFHYMHSFLNWSMAHSILVCCGILLYCGLDVLVVHAKEATPVQYRYPGLLWHYVVRLGCLSRTCQENYSSTI